jgi:hypothetical protein
MIVDDLDLISDAVAPDEADSQLAVDADPVLATAVAAVRFQAVPRWNRRSRNRPGATAEESPADASQLSINRARLGSPARKRFLQSWYSHLSARDARGVTLLVEVSGSRVDRPFQRRAGW